MAVEEKEKRVPKSLAERLAMQLKNAGLEEADDKATGRKEAAAKMATMLSNVGNREHAELRKKLEQGKETERQMMDQYLKSIGAVRNEGGEITLSTAPYARAVVQPISEMQVQEYFNNSMISSAVNIRSEDLTTDTDLLSEQLGLKNDVTSETIGVEQNRLIDQYRQQQDQMKEEQRRMKEKVESRKQAAKEEKQENESKAINEALKISKEQETRFDEQRSRQEDQVKRMVKERKQKKKKLQSEQNDEFLVAETKTDESGFVENVTIVDETLTERLDPLGASCSDFHSEENGVSKKKKRKNKKIKKHELEISDLD
ncbi:hypothetical protein Ciccas_006335 [Cichlidogyrus casuarinus]|uniref:Uncharacterized protein n=1 Tax=Cichlidogyrus casuarinus TaxID=1844966 RepID=A0ABD2Q631_9PLAT